MLLAEFLSEESNPHSKHGNPHVNCNALYKTRTNINCYLTASQAIEHARHLLEKAQLLLDNDVEDGVVHVWNQGESSERLNVGLNQARKGPRRKANLKSTSRK